jgi:hypothetical protein
MATLPVGPLPLNEKPSAFSSPKYSGYICPEYGRETMIIVPLAEAKNNLSKLVDDAAAEYGGTAPKENGTFRCRSPSLQH